MKSFMFLVVATVTLSGVFAQPAMAKWIMGKDGKYHDCLQAKGDPIACPINAPAGSTCTCGQTTGCGCSAEGASLGFGGH